MKRTVIILKLILVFIILTLAFFSPSCKKEASKRAVTETASVTGIEVDAQKIRMLTGVPFNILKTETIGYAPLHKFYWISIQKIVSNQKVEELADAIIKETIAEKPKTFHSFTIHFFWEDELAENLSESKRFARATFLPDGDWRKVGRIPIDDYKSYKLECKFIK